MRFKCENIFVAKELTFTLCWNISEKVFHGNNALFRILCEKCFEQYSVLNSRIELEFLYLNWVLSHSLNCCYIWFLFFSDNFLQNYEFSLILEFFSSRLKPNILPICQQETNQITKNNETLLIGSRKNSKSSGTSSRSSTSAFTFWWQYKS